MKNVILIMADQLRLDYLGCYGNPCVHTPNIDRIGNMGVRFQNCFANNPVCMPNRMSIITGRYVHNHQLWMNGVLLPSEQPSIGGELHRNGYATALIGKAHLEPYGVNDPFPQISREDWRKWENPDMQKWHGPYWGYDHVELVLSHTTKPVGHYKTWFYKKGGKKEMSDVNYFSSGETQTTWIPEALHDSSYIGERSAEYIRKKKEENEPYFLTVSFPDPHHPFNPPQETAKRYEGAPVYEPRAEGDEMLSRPGHYREYRAGTWNPAGAPEEKYQNKSSNVPLAWSKKAPVSEEEKKKRIRNTYAMIDLIDRAVGRIIGTLEELGELDHTILIFTSDHGELMGDHGLWKKGPFFFDGELRVPLLIYDPDFKQNGTATRSLASSIDIYPTVFDLLGKEWPEYIDGVSLVPAMEQRVSREFCLAEYRTGFISHDLHANIFIDEEYKFIQYNTGECELTDRKNDPDELNNLAADGKNHALVEKYREKLLLSLLNTAPKYPERISLF